MVCFNVSYKVCLDLRSSHRRCSVKQVVLRNFVKFTGKHLCEISKNTIFIKHLRTTASDISWKLITFSFAYLFFILLTPVFILISCFLIVGNVSLVQYHWLRFFLTIYSLPSCFCFCCVDVSFTFTCFPFFLNFLWFLNPAQF